MDTATTDNFKRYVEKAVDMGELPNGFYILEDMQKRIDECDEEIYKIMVGLPNNVRHVNDALGTLKKDTEKLKTLLEVRAYYEIMFDAIYTD